MARSLLSDSIDVKRFLGGDCPGDLVELRRAVWAQETGLLSEQELFDENDRNGIHFLVYDKANGNALVASTCVVEAERSNFASQTGLPEAVLRDTVISTRSTVQPEYRGAGLFSFIVYLGGREARMRQRRWMAGYLERGMTPGRALTGSIDIKGVPARQVMGREGIYEVVATAADTNCVMSRCFQRIPESLHPYLREHLFADEVVAEIMRGAKRFYEGAWFEAIDKGRLTRWQYCQTLAEMHLYVRWTTRLLGTVIGISSEPDLRRHYINHLMGEIDHEVLLENDLAHLGFDVEYVKHQLAPSENILAFMGLQESLCSGLRRDPALFLAVPLAIEALTAFVTQKFIDQLSANIASWGVVSPERAMTFLVSHIRSDGGTDGHWDAARRILHRHLRGEQELQRFLSIVRLAQKSMYQAFTSYVAGTDIFAAR